MLGGVMDLLCARLHALGHPTTRATSDSPPSVSTVPSHTFAFVSAALTGAAQVAQTEAFQDAAAGAARAAVTQSVTAQSDRSKAKTDTGSNPFGI